MNCWEFKGCGREPGGAQEAALGVCPATTETRCHGVNGGANAGRACWLVAGTLCGGEVQGEFARKMSTCLECDFYRMVCQQEGESLSPDSEILLLISDPCQMVRAYEELRRMFVALKETQAQLIEARKLEAIGRLAAGVAHEINTPTQFIGDNLEFLKEAFSSLLEVVEVSSRLLHAAKATAQIIPHLRSSVERADVAFLSENIPRALEQSLEGTKRVAEIVRAMKDFSHPDSDAMEPADIHRLITTTLTVSRSAWRPVAEVVTDFDRSMPLVPCFVKDLNQVLLNLVVNAAQAMAPVPGSESTGKGTLHVSTLLNAEVAEIRISDTGSGIPRDLHHRIFEPFFTTKEVGKGTGQGLYMAHSTIVKKHQGTLTFDSTPGGGTTFIIGLPLQPVA